jgi:Clostripain family
MTAKARWTLLTYIAAHNNLAAMGTKSLHEILAVGSSDDVVLGALYDGPAGAARYVMGDPGFVRVQEPLGAAFDSGDPDALIATSRWLFEQHPAERYGLVLWSHGSGWEPAEIEAVANEVRPEPQVNARERQERASAPASRCLFRTTLRKILKPAAAPERAILFDDGSGHSLDTLELARVVGAIAAAVGQPLELLGMDACLMANVEVACEVRRDVRYLVASEELVPGHSWPYQDVFGALRAKPLQGGADFARLIVEHYASFYAENPPLGGDVTKIALDLGQIDPMLQACGGLALALRDGMDQAADALWQSQQATRARETRDGKRTPSKFDFDLWDLRSLAAELARSDAVPVAVRQAALAAMQACGPAAGAVLAERHVGAWFDGIGGASIWLKSPGRQRISPSYAQLAFAQETQWDKMLQAYHQALS